MYLLVTHIYLFDLRTIVYSYNFCFCHFRFEMINCLSFDLILLILSCWLTGWWSLVGCSMLLVNSCLGFEIFLAQIFWFLGLVNLSRGLECLGELSCGIRHLSCLLGLYLFFIFWNLCKFFLLALIFLLLLFLLI